MLYVSTRFHLIHDAIGHHLKVGLLSLAQKMRFGIDDAQGSNRLPRAGAQRHAGIEANSSLFDEWIARESLVFQQIGHDEGLICRDHMAANGFFARTAARCCKVSGQTGLRFPDLPFVIDKRHQ